MAAALLRALRFRFENNKKTRQLVQLTGEPE